MHELGPLAEDIYRGKKYDFDGRENWSETSQRVASNVLGALGYAPDSDVVCRVAERIRRRQFIPGGRYLYSAGRPLHQTQNCLLLRAEDTREGWSDTYWKANTALMTGAGIGIDYSELRSSGTLLKRTGGTASGPIPHVLGVDSLGRAAVQGGSRRAAIWAGLRWDHPDVMEFIRMKDWPEEMRALKKKHRETPMPGEFTNISVILDDDFFDAMRRGNVRAWEIYQSVLNRMLKTGEPGFSIDVGENTGESLRNACTEITSRDDSDICNLGSINLGRIDSLSQLEEVTWDATLFLLAGTVYSDVPYAKVAEVRSKNRRLGLGLMGLHEWMIQRELPYGPSEELGRWLEVYARSGVIADSYANQHGLSAPVKTRAIAPTGTIAMIGETTTGVEPVFAKAYWRRYLDAGAWIDRPTVDPTVERYVKQGYDPDKIEDAYSIEPERRVRFQAWLQQFVDHGISSTINLPAPIREKSEQQEFGNMLLQRLPDLRGITVYPDGARDHQPLEVLAWDEAAALGATTFESDERCASGACGV